MTAYGKPHKEAAQQPAWIQAKEARKQVLAGVRARRREMYRKFLARKNQTPGT